MKTTPTLPLDGVTIESGLASVQLTIKTDDPEAVVMANRLAAVFDATGDISGMRAERNALLQRFSDLLAETKTQSNLGVHNSDEGPTLDEEIDRVLTPGTSPGLREELSASKPPTRGKSIDTDEFLELVAAGVGTNAVSYTHLTLPTKRIV